jgi:hypothetical protein
MKNLLIKRIVCFLITIILLLACSKNDDANCDCGIIEDIGIVDYFASPEEYYIDIRNSCTNEIENGVKVTFNIYTNNFAGDKLCDITKIRLN